MNLYHAWGRLMNALIVRPAMSTWFSPAPVPNPKKNADAAQKIVAALPASRESAERWLRASRKLQEEILQSAGYKEAVGDAYHAMQDGAAIAAGTAPASRRSAQSHSIRMGEVTHFDPTGGRVSAEDYVEQIMRQASAIARSLLPAREPASMRLRRLPGMPEPLRQGIQRAAAARIRALKADASSPRVFRGRGATR